MSAFTLDTSGFVEGRPEGVRTKRFYWTDLDPFAQGYVEALLTAFWNTVLYATRIKPRGFRDLAPETLAAILKDCAAQPGNDHLVCTTTRQHDNGVLFWRKRQRGEVEGFPPLTPYLGGDGKVYLREASQ